MLQRPNLFAYWTGGILEEIGFHLLHLQIASINWNLQTKYYKSVSPIDQCCRCSRFQAESGLWAVFYAVFSCFRLCLQLKETTLLIFVFVFEANNTGFAKLGVPRELFFNLFYIWIADIF